MKNKSTMNYFEVVPLDLIREILLLLPLATVLKFFQEKKYQSIEGSSSFWDQYSWIHYLVDSSVRPIIGTDEHPVISYPIGYNGKQHAIFIHYLLNNYFQGKRLPTVQSLQIRYMYFRIKGCCKSAANKRPIRYSNYIWNNIKGECDMRPNYLLTMVPDESHFNGLGFRQIEVPFSSAELETISNYDISDLEKINESNVTPNEDRILDLYRYLIGVITTPTLYHAPNDEIIIIPFDPSLFVFISNDQKNSGSQNVDVFIKNLQKKIHDEKYIKYAQKFFL